MTVRNRDRRSPRSSATTDVRRRGFDGRILAAVFLVISVACGSSDAPPASTIAAATTAAPTTTQTTDPPTTTSTEAEDTTTTTAEVADVDAGPILAAALDAVGTRYRYTSTVTTDGQVTSTVTGVIDGESFSAVIETADTSVEYRKTPDGEWTLGSDGVWVALDEPAPVSNPIAPLRNPTDVEVVAETDSRVDLLATYPGSVLGIDAETITITYVVVEGVVAEIAYETTIGSAAVVVLTEITDVGTVDPISSPDI